MPRQIDINPSESGSNEAANLVRAKLRTLYSDEPNVVEEEQEISITGAQSKHQLFIAGLMKSGKSLEDIQTEWHNYYTALSDSERRLVWQEFYENQSRARVASTNQQSTPDQLAPPEQVSEDDPKELEKIHQKIIRKINANGKLGRKDHIKSIVFAVMLGLFVSGVFSLITFNQIVLARFIQPSRDTPASPIITDGSSVGPEPKIIIPKINLEAPIVIDASSNSEADIQEALERGVTLYPDTGKPGEIANPILFGHSSNNLFNRGAYKFVFVRLRELQVGDTYAINYGGKQYVYKIFSRDIVTPDRVDVLYARPKDVMSTLITCDPPGTSNTRLVLHAEQISPDPLSNVASTTPDSEARPAQIPSDSPSFWRQLFGW